MYKEYFNLKELPFSIAPNPRYLYLTRQHQEALAHLVYGLNSAGGIILLTGEVGTGKTTISRKLLEDIPEQIDIAWIVNPRLSVEELLAAICDELSIAYPENNHSIKTFTDLISSCLIHAHGQGRNVVLMIDEAQNLSPEVLEQLRLLTNLETNERKLLQIVLLGQPELKTMLERTDLRQLAQRITARYHLHPLTRYETIAYIRHRLAVGGCERPVFSPAAMKLIYRVSHGTPRLINLLCDRAMLGVYSSNGTMVHPKHVRQSCREVLGDTAIPKRSVLVPLTAIILLAITGALFATGEWKNIHAYFKPVAAHQALPLSETETNPDTTSPITTAVSIAGIHTVSGAAQVTAPNPELNQAQQAEPVKNRAPENKTKSVTPAATDKNNTLTKTAIIPWDIIEKTGTQMLAFQTLAGIWHSKISSTEGEPCSQLSDNRLSCLNQHANIWLIRAMNRPAIFHIKGKDGAHHYSIIRFISHGYAFIQLGSQQWRIPLSELKKHMQDQISLIWFKPPGYQKDIQQGDSGQTVEWLSRQLDHIQGTMIPSRQFHSMDDILTERLKAFQQSERMTPDGIAGILTLMRINERIGLDIPRLQQETKH